MLALFERFSGCGVAGVRVAGARIAEELDMALWIDLESFEGIDLGGGGTHLSSRNCDTA